MPTSSRLKPQSGFAETLKQHLATWRQHDKRLQTDGAHPWVLNWPLRAHNYFGDQEWYELVAGKLHHWGHALNSSQAFAVNLFAPARFSADVARALWKVLPAGALHSDPQRVDVQFEYSGPDESFAKRQLGEAGVPTQIDVALQGIFENGVRRFQFVEVKLTESHFGMCRGAGTGKKAVNPAPERCQSLARVHADPAGQCWLTESEHRRYWELTRLPLGLTVIADEMGGCPWQGGLYQLMRNWALARALVEYKIAVSVDLSVCVHPGNQEATRLRTAVAGTNNLLQAFNAMATPMKVVDLDLQKLLKVQDAAGAPSGWRTYMETRYLLA